MNIDALTWVGLLIDLAIAGLIIVALCNSKYPAPIPGFPQDAARYPVVIRRVSGGCAFLYSHDFVLLVNFCLSIGIRQNDIKLEPGSQAYSIYLQAKHADKVQQLYGV